MTDWREQCRLGNQIADIAKTRADNSGHDPRSREWLSVAVKECCRPAYVPEKR